MDFFGKISSTIVSAISQLFRGGPNGISTGFRSTNFQEYGCFEETDSVSR